MFKVQYLVRVHDNRDCLVGTYWTDCDDFFRTEAEAWETVIDPNYDPSCEEQFRVVPLEV